MTDIVDPAARGVRRRAHHGPAGLPRGAGRRPAGHAGVPGHDGRPARGPVPRDADLRPRGHARSSRSAPSAATRPCPWPPGLAPGGRITTCELSPVHAEFARRHIAASPYADRIEVMVGPAIDTIATLDGPFDLVFIDADKAGLPRLLRGGAAQAGPRGLIAADNTLWSGRILDPSDTTADTVALRAVQRRRWPPTPGWWWSRPPSATASPSSAGPAEPDRDRPTVLDYHLHLWPHSPERRRDHRRTGGRLLRAGRRRRGDRDRRHRAPVPVHPGQGPARRVLGRPARRGAAARAWPPTGTTTPGSTSTPTSRWSRRSRPRASRWCSGSRSTTTRTGWTTWPTCWPATPSTSCSARCTGSGPGGSTS